jgi:hypothetical protein
VNRESLNAVLHGTTRAAAGQDPAAISTASVSENRAILRATVPFPAPVEEQASQKRPLKARGGSDRPGHGSNYPQLAVPVDLHHRDAIRRGQRPCRP